MPPKRKTYWACETPSSGNISMVTGCGKQDISISNGKCPGCDRSRNQFYPVYHGKRAVAASPPKPKKKKKKDKKALTATTTTGGNKLEAIEEKE